MERRRREAADLEECSFVPSLRPPNGQGVPGQSKGPGPSGPVSSSGAMPAPAGPPPVLSGTAGDGLNERPRIGIGPRRIATHGRDLDGYEWAQPEGSPGSPGSPERHAHYYSYAAAMTALKGGMKARQ